MTKKFTRVQNLITIKDIISSLCPDYVIPVESDSENNSENNSDLEFSKNKSRKEKNKKKIVSELNNFLSPNEIEKSKKFPKKFKKFFKDKENKFHRMGIIINDKSLSTSSNISFFTSILYCLIKKTNIDSKILDSFINALIIGVDGQLIYKKNKYFKNYGIRKKDIIENLKECVMTEHILQYTADYFNLNIWIFDKQTTEIYLYKSNNKKKLNKYFKHIFLYKETRINKVNLDNMKNKEKSDSDNDTKKEKSDKENSDEEEVDVDQEEIKKKSDSEKENRTDFQNSYFTPIINKNDTIFTYNNPIIEKLNLENILVPKIGLNSDESEDEYFKFKLQKLKSVVRKINADKQYLRDKEEKRRKEKEEWMRERGFLKDKPKENENENENEESEETQNNSKKKKKNRGNKNNF